MFSVFWKTELKIKVHLIIISNNNNYDNENNKYYTIAVVITAAAVDVNFKLFPCQRRFFCRFCRLLVTFANSLDPDLDR